MNLDEFQKAAHMEPDTKVWVKIDTLWKMVQCLGVSAALIDAWEAREDLDEVAKHLRNDLKWLGITFDAPPEA